MDVSAVDGNGPEVQSLLLLKPELPVEIRVGRRVMRPLFGRGRGAPWVAGADIAGPRAGTILYAPTRETLQVAADHSPRTPILLAESFDPALREALPEGAVALPRLVPAMFFPPGPGADTFGVTRRLHLEGRPRLVYVGRYDEGASLTMLFELTRRLLTMGGEVVLWEGMSRRSALAPVVKTMRLSETIVFAPPLSPEEAAGLLLGADVVWVGESNPRQDLALTWAMASGTPIVARYSKPLEAVLGPAALWVYDDDLAVFEQALLTALQNAVIREALQKRQEELAQPWRRSEAAPEWMAAFADARGPR